MSGMEEQTQEFWVAEGRVRVLQHELREATKQMQLLCRHRWFLLPVSGDGKVCTVCGAYGSEEDQNGE